MQRRARFLNGLTTSPQWISMHRVERQFAKDNKSSAVQASHQLHAVCRRSKLHSISMPTVLLMYPQKIWVPEENSILPLLQVPTFPIQILTEQSKKLLELEAQDKNVGRY